MLPITFPGLPNIWSDPLLGLIHPLTPSGAYTETTTVTDPNPRDPSASTTSTNDSATANFGYVSGLTTTDIVILALAAVAGLYLWKKL